MLEQFLKAERKRDSRMACKRKRGAIEDEDGDRDGEQEKPAKKVVVRLPLRKTANPRLLQRPSRMHRHPMHSMER